MGGDRLEGSVPVKATKNSRRSCTNCGKTGHDRRNCNKPRLNSSGAVVVSQRKCTRCGSAKHDRRTCTLSVGQIQMAPLGPNLLQHGMDPNLPPHQGVQPLFHTGECQRVAERRAEEARSWSTNLCADLPIYYISATKSNVVSNAINIISHTVRYTLVTAIAPTPGVPPGFPPILATNHFTPTAKPYTAGIVPPVFQMPVIPQHLERPVIPGCAQLPFPPMMVMQAARGVYPMGIVPPVVFQATPGSAPPFPPGVAGGPSVGAANIGRPKDDAVQALLSFGGPKQAAKRTREEKDPC